MITVIYDDFTEGEYETEQDVEDALLEALAEGVQAIMIHDSDDDNKLYSVIWSAELQKEH